MTKLALAAIALAGAAGTAAAAPGTTSFTARITTPSGTPIDGNVAVSFKLYDAATAGNLIWSEDQPSVAADKGLLFARLGAVHPLDDTTFPGGVRYLEITVDGDVLSPRLAIDSVPYAISASTADRALTSDTLGNLAEADVQQRVGGACPAGSSIRAIATDGTVTCETDDDTNSGGTITGVTAGTGLSGGGATGAVSLSVNTTQIQARVGSTCAAGSSIRAIAADGTVTCETDDAGAGTITGVTAGTGLTGGGATGAVSLSVNTNLIQSRVGGACAAGSSIRAIAADGTVTCEVDDDTNSGGTITGVTAGTGLSGGGATGGVSLSVNTAVIQARVGTACAVGSSIRAIAADGSVTCETDDTGGVGTITGVTAGTGLTGGGTSGGVSLAVNPAVVQARVGTACAVGSSIRAIAADGSVTCEIDDDTNSGGTITGVTAGTGLTGGGSTGGVSLGIAPNGVTMAHTSAPISSAQISGIAGVPPEGANYYPTAPFTADSNGSCLVISRAFTTTTNQSLGYLRLLSSVRENGVDLTPNTAFANTDPFPSISTLSIMAQTSGTSSLITTYGHQVTNERVIQVSQGRTYQFGCLLGWQSSAQAFVNSTFVCHTSYVCQ